MLFVSGIVGLPGGGEIDGFGQICESFLQMAIRSAEAEDHDGQNHDHDHDGRERRQPGRGNLLLAVVTAENWKKMNFHKA